MYIFLKKSKIQNSGCFATPSVGKGLYQFPDFLYAAVGKKVASVFPSKVSGGTRNYMAGLVSNHSLSHGVRGCLGKRNKIKMNASKIVNNLDRLVSIEYSLDNYHRSNQDTCLVHKPSVFEGQWVQSGDLLADCSASVGGELALGQNILIAYMPWEGYNFEDAILVSERLVYDDLYTSVHIERYEVEVKETKLGIEEITRSIPDIDETSLKHLNHFGIAKLGSWVEEGDILVGKVTPVNKKIQSNYQKLLYTILDKTVLPIRDSSLRAPKGIKAKVIGVQVLYSQAPNVLQTKGGKTSIKQGLSEKITPLQATVINTSGQPKSTKGQTKKLSSGHPGSMRIKSESLFGIEKKKRDIDHSGTPTFNKNNCFLKKQSVELINLYGMPQNNNFVGYRKFKFFSLRKKKGSLTILQNKLKNKQLENKTNRFTHEVRGEPSKYFKNGLYFHGLKQSFHKLKNYGLEVCIDMSPEFKNSSVMSTIQAPQYQPYIQSLPLINADTRRVGIAPAGSTLYGFPNKAISNKTSDNLNFLKNFFGSHTKKQLSSKKKGLPDFNQFSTIEYPNLKNLNNVSSVQIFLAEKRRIQVGDKMAGRHGNKGIISQIIPIEDMPFLPDGKPLDMVLNPLGVPSRMNVGQIYECLLGLAGKYLGENFKVFPFDEMYGAEASRSFVFSKLSNARLKTGKEWLFNFNSPGKIRLYDGRTGETFDQAITVGYAYILRLVHMVDDKIHARSTGPYSLVTQQPLRGRSKQGGQRLGEMEVWALEGYGAAFTLLEMLTIKSDDMTGRMTLWSNLILNKEISIGTPESFKVLICELQALCLDIGLFKIE